MIYDLPGTKQCCWSQIKLFTDIWVTIAYRMMASNNLQMMEVRLLSGCYMGLLLNLSLCLVVMLPCFQPLGRLPSSSDLRRRMSSGVLVPQLFLCALAGAIHLVLATCWG